MPEQIGEGFLSKPSNEWTDADFKDALRYSIIEGVLETIRFPWVKDEHGQLCGEQVACNIIHHALFCDVMAHTIINYGVYVAEAFVDDRAERDQVVEQIIQRVERARFDVASEGGVALMQMETAKVFAESGYESIAGIVLATIGDVCKYHHYEWQAEAINICRREWLSICINRSPFHQVRKPSVALACSCIEHIVDASKGRFDDELANGFVMSRGSLTDTAASVFRSGPSI